MNLVRGILSVSVLLGGILLNVADAQELPLSKLIQVSDESDRDLLNTIDPGPLADDGDPIIVRERANLTQDALQIRTFLEFDLSSLTVDDVADPGFRVLFEIDYTRRLNTVNAMGALIGRVQDDGINGDSWSESPGSFPLYEWGGANAVGGQTFLENALTEPPGEDVDFDDIRKGIEVTDIVKDWGNGTHSNNGFVLYGSGDIFQGVTFNDPSLTVVGSAGDFNGDGVVNDADFLILNNNLAAHLDGPVEHSDGDWNIDGRVDLEDFSGFQLQNPAVVAQALGVAIPEPNTMTLLLPALLLLGFYGRRSSK